MVVFNGGMEIWQLAILLHSDDVVQNTGTDVACGTYWAKCVDYGNSAQDGRAEGNIDVSVSGYTVQCMLCFSQPARRLQSPSSLRVDDLSAYLCIGRLRSFASRDQVTAISPAIPGTQETKHRTTTGDNSGNTQRGFVTARTSVLHQLL